MKQDNQLSLTPKDFIALEDELYRLKAENNISLPRNKFFIFGDYILEYMEKKKMMVNRNKYIRLAWTCGWFCGAHKFYAKRRIMGMLYLLFFWTGIPFSMTLIDIMIALPKKENENGNIEI